MKNSLEYISFGFLILFAFAAIGVGQERVITEAEYQQVENKAKAYTEKSTYRRTLRAFRFSKESPSTPSLEVNSIDEASRDKQENRSRKLFIVKETYSMGGNARIPSTTFESERIEIGRDVYIRDDPEKWLKNPEVRYPVKPSPASGLDSEPMAATYKYLGKRVLNENPVDVYESVLDHEYKVSRDDPRFEKQIETMWIDDAGRFLKVESRSIEADGFASSRTTEVYEYPAEIKIEAPIK